MISVDSTNNSPSFKQVSVLKVPKKLYEKPTDLSACEDEIAKQLDKLSGNKHGILDNLLVLLGVNKRTKTAQITEGCDGLRLYNEPENDEFHYTTVFTSEDCEYITNIFKLQNLDQINQFCEETKQDLNDILLDLIRKCPSGYINNQPKNQFEIKQWKDLTQIKSNLGL